MLGRRLADTPRSCRGVPLRGKSSPATMTTVAIIVDHHHHHRPRRHRRLLFVFIGRGKKAKQRREKSVTGGTINSYAEHVHADTHTRTTAAMERAYAFSTFSIRYTKYSAANRGARGYKYMPGVFLFCRPGRLIRKIRR